MVIIFRYFSFTFYLHIVHFISRKISLSLVCAGETCLTESYSSKEICIWQIVSNQRFVNDRLVCIHVYTQLYAPQYNFIGLLGEIPAGVIKQVYFEGINYLIKHLSAKIKLNEQINLRMKK